MLEQAKIDQYLKTGVEFELFFDNGGGITLQTFDYRHTYHGDTGINQAAKDVLNILLGANPAEEWDGNDIDDDENGEYALEYDVNEEMNGSYKHYNKLQVIGILNKNLEVDHNGYSEEKFFRIFNTIINLIKKLLSANDYNGSELLVNPSTKTVDTAENWAVNAVCNKWECQHCEDDKEHDYETCIGSLQHRFDALKKVSPEEIKND